MILSENGCHDIKNFLWFLFIKTATPCRPVFSAGPLNNMVWPAFVVWSPEPVHLVSLRPHIDIECSGNTLSSSSSLAWLRRVLMFQHPIRVRVRVFRVEISL